MRKIAQIFVAFSEKLNFIYVHHAKYQGGFKNQSNLEMVVHKNTLQLINTKLLIF